MVSFECQMNLMINSIYYYLGEIESMFLLQTTLLKFRIINPVIDMSTRQIRKNRKDSFNPLIGIRHQKLGACIMNQPLNRNLLTQEYVDEFYRFLTSYHYDHSIENIWIESKDNVFSHGVDYKGLTQSPEYYDKLFKFILLLGRVNKPIFSQVSGGVQGIAAYVLSMFTCPLGYQNAYLRIDETAKGFIPILGGSHRLTRLPLALGYYLALTGDKLSSEEMAKLGLLKGFLKDGTTNVEIRKRLSEANLYFRDPVRLTAEDTDPIQLNQYKQILEKQVKSKHRIELSQEQIVMNPNSNMATRFALNQHAMASIDYANATLPYNSFSDKPGHSIINYFQKRFERPAAYLIEHELINVSEYDYIDMPRLNLQKIANIFGRASLAEIINALESDSSEWAKQTLASIQNKDQLSLCLTFELLKKSEQLSWIQSLEMEYTVGRRLLNQSKLALKTYQKGSHYILQNQFSNTNALQIPQEVISEFFLPPKLYQQKLEHETGSKSLHPASDYFDTLPDSARIYLNREMFDDKNSRNHIREVQRYLEKNKIDYRSQTFDVNVLREAVHERKEEDLELNRQKQRLEYYAIHDKASQNYQHEKFAYLQTLTKEFFEDKIKETVKKVFKDKLEKRFEEFEKKTAEIAGKEQRIQIFKNVREIMIENILYKGDQIEKNNAEKQNFRGLIYFDKEGKDLYSSVNPNLSKDSLLKELSNQFNTNIKLTQEFKQKIQNDHLPKNIGMDAFLKPHEKHNQDMASKIKERYNDQPEIWTEAYTYKVMVAKAAQTSEELAGLLEWKYQDYFNTIQSYPKTPKTYSDFAVNVEQRLLERRNQQKKKLSEIKKLHQQLDKSVLGSKSLSESEYEMNEMFPYLFQNKLIPQEFKEPFLNILNDTLQHFVKKYVTPQQKLIFNGDLESIDTWISNNIAETYTEKLKADVQYVASYQAILFVKEILLKIKNNTQLDDVEILTQTLYKNYGVKLNAKQFENIEELTPKFNKFLYFLMDLHTQSKKNLITPQAKLLDFINRLKVRMQNDEITYLPYSFEGLMLMIARDRRRIYDKYLNEVAPTEAELVLSMTYKDSKLKKERELYKDIKAWDEENLIDLRNYLFQESIQIPQSKKLVNNYFYYMMLFEQFVQKACGKQSFLPKEFDRKEELKLLQHIKCLIKPQSNHHWFTTTLEEVVIKLLEQRETREKLMSKGQLYLSDHSFSEAFQVEVISQLMKAHLMQEITIVKELFYPSLKVQEKLDRHQQSQVKYTRYKWEIKNPKALKLLNNMEFAEEIKLDYNQQNLRKSLRGKERQQSIREQLQYNNIDEIIRLPDESYHRMYREAKSYPGELADVIPKENYQLFKDNNLEFIETIQPKKLKLSNFQSQYVKLSESIKHTALDEMVEKIKLVQGI